MAEPDREAIEAQFREAFDEVSGGDGKITADDLKAALEKAGASPSDDQIQAIMDAADTEGTGSISFEEFVQAIVGAQFTKLRIVAALRLVFRVADAVQSGKVTVDQLKEAAAEKGLADKIDQDKLEALIEALEGAADGEVTYEDFLEKIQEMDFE